MRYSGEERREQIVNESIKIIYEQSFLQFTIRELAKQVGLSEAGIYRHFDSKDDIILQILERMEDFGQKIVQETEQISDPLEKLKQLFLLQLEYFTENKEMSMILLSGEIFSNNEKIKAKYTDMLNHRFERLKDLLFQAAQQGYIEESKIEDTAFMIQGTMRGLVFRWNLNEYQFDLKNRGKQLLETIFSNFKPK